MGGPIFLETSTPRERPQSLIELISLIQQYGTVELYGAKVPPETLQLKNHSTFAYAGFKGGFGGMALSVVLLPLSLAVLETLVPVFGGEATTRVASLYDRAWGFLMTFFWPLGYWALFITQVAPCYWGQAPMKMIGWLCSGWIAGLAVKTVLGVIAYHLLLFLAPPARLMEWLLGEGTLALLLQPFVGPLDRLAWVHWYERFYPLWITASGWLIGTAVALSATLVIALWIGHRIARRRHELNTKYEMLG